jgi:hypothetical protein
LVCGEDWRRNGRIVGNVGGDRIIGERGGEWGRIGVRGVVWVGWGGRGRQW